MLDHPLNWGFVLVTGQRRRAHRHIEINRTLITRPQPEPIPHGVTDPGSGYDRRVAANRPGNPNTGDETDQERLNRNVNELLQELRVAQTGVQILFVFLLGMTFADGFEDIDGFLRMTHLVTTLLAMTAAAALIAPAAWHRVLFRQGGREHIVRAANRVALLGLVLMAAAMTGAVLLVSTVSAGRTAGMWIAVATVLLFLGVWFLVPRWIRRHRID